MKMSREFYVPSNSKEVRQEGVDAVVYYGTSGSTGRPNAMGFSGKRSKYDFYYSFTSEERRDAYVAEFFANLKARAAAKAERQAKAKAYKTGLKVGDVLYASWGYDQTNVNFYQVVEVVSDKSVRIRGIGAMVVSGDAYSERVVPAVDSFREDDTFLGKGNPASLKRVSEGDYVRLRNYCGASRYTSGDHGVYQTGPHGGH